MFGSVRCLVLSPCLGLLLTASLFANEPNPTTSSGPNTVEIDFDTALRGLGFDPSTVDGNGGPSAAPNGLLDAAEMSLIAAVLAGEPAAEDRAAVLAAWKQALASAEQDTKALSDTFPTTPTAIAGYAMIGTKESFDAVAAMTATFGTPLEGDYSLAAALGDLFGPDGDADGDGFTNRQEYAVTISEGTAAYVAAALDPLQTPDPDALAAATLEPVDSKMKVGVVLYPGFEVLDVYGPVEMWAYVPGFELVMIANQVGPVMSAQGIATVADHSFESAPPLDVILVPGGVGTFAAAKQPEMLQFLRQRHAETDLTTSVCTGSILLAAAGLLDDRKATSNKLHFHLAQDMGQAVEWIEKARWVDDGDIVTSSGVSAGMDMALYVVARLFGDPQAQQIATWTEYVWNQDPNDDPFVSSISASHHAGH